MKKILFFIVLATSINNLKAEPHTLHLTLQTRDPKTNQIITKTEDVDPSKVGIIIIDPWNFHWCITASERVTALAPRWNRALECARKLGMHVMWAPTEAASMYAGTPQRERAAAVPYIPVPKTRVPLNAKFTLPERCMCGPGISCEVNYGLDAMCPDLVIDENDYIISGLEETWAICKQLGLTHILFMGLHTNICLYGRSVGLVAMYGTGMDCMMARDINDACTFYDPARPFTPDDGTAQTVEAIEKAGVPTINMVEEMQKARLWKKEWIVDPVRLTPWGTQQRPYFFEKSVSIALTCPWVEGTEIHYTLDGSTPTMLSARYEKPVPITSTTSLRAGAFRKGRLVSLIGSGYFVHLEPVPPLPDVYLDQLTPIKEHYDYWYSSWHPVTNQSFSFKPLLMRGKSYEKGIGMRAPSNVRYELKPEYDRFVARVGVDGNLRNLGPEAYGLPANGTYKGGGQGILYAQQSSVQFRVFIDGKLAAESPVMRFSQEPWRFDVKIPTGSRLINLVCMDAGSRSILDLGNWVDAGFCTK